MSTSSWASGDGIMTLSRPGAIAAGLGDGTILFVFYFFDTIELDEGGEHGGDEVGEAEIKTDGDDGDDNDADGGNNRNLSGANYEDKAT